MPKGLNLKNFGRRKSSANALDFEPEAESAPAQSSFRVLERQDRGKTTYGAPVSRPEKSSSRPFNSPLHALRGKSADDLGLYPNRGSGGTTNSGSSGYYDSSSASARYSSTSTLPSSVDQDHHQEDELFPARKVATTGMYHTLAINADEPPPPPPPPSFSSRAARALSFGNVKGRTSKDIPPPVPVHKNGAPSPTYQPYRAQSPHRERAMTTSSYASTAVPAREELTLTSPDFGNDDFSNMFDSLKHESPLPPAGGFHRTESEPMFPPRTHSRNALTPSPNREYNNASPYSQDDRNSNDGLMLSPALSSPNTVDGGAPGPAVGNGITQAFNLGSTKSGYSRVPERYTSPGPERASISSYSSVMEDAVDNKTDHDYFPHRQTQVDDEDRWVKRVELRDPPVAFSPVSSKADTNTSSTATTRHALTTQQSTSGASRSGAASPRSAAEDSIFSAGSNATTPRAARLDVKDNSMYDASPNGPSKAVRPSIHQRTESGSLKKMTPAQFKALQRHGNGDSAEHSDEEDLSDNDYDDEDEQERIKRLANQRRKQEANMSVYRQQMKKVTGGGPSDLPSSAASTVRPSMDRGSTAPAGGMAIHFGGIGGAPPPETLRGKPDDDEDDDVPLGILQAHGFPSGSRPPTQQDNDLHQRRASAAGSIVNGGAGQGPLPPFARRLPADPYFGAGLVNQSTRESLAMNSSGASMMGVPSMGQPMAQQQQPPPPMPQASPMGHPGGLVGVIAGEERAKAARRGSPNTAAGGYNTMGNMGNMPLPSNMNMPPMPRANSMGNLAPPSVYAPSGAPPVPMIPPQFGGMGQMSMMPQMPQVAGQNQQVMDMMQMQMQLMQNMLQMQNMQLGTPGAQRPGTPGTMQHQQQGQQQQQSGDYLGVNFGDNRPMSVASQATGYGFPQTQNNGRAMTMMNPPSSWTQPPQLGGPRPNSAMPLQGSSYAPSVNGLTVNGGGPGNGYTPSIAPSERSNVGMPSRYRPVTREGETSRSQSMTSSLTLNAFAKQQTSPNLPGTPFNGTQAQTPKSTIRVVDKAKGAPKIQSRQVDDDEEDGWADMKKKREEKKRFKWGKKSTAQSTEPTLNDLYQGLE